MKIGIANDHSAVDMKNEIVEYLESLGHEVVNYGTDSYESCNYPEFGEKIGNAVASGEVEQGIAICGTGAGNAHFLRLGNPRRCTGSCWDCGASGK